VFSEVNDKIKQELDEIIPEDCAKDEKKLEHFYFTQLCDKQPIGKHLFGDFCMTAEKSIKDVYALTQAIRNYEASKIQYHDSTNSLGYDLKNLKIFYICDDFFYFIFRYHSLRIN